MTMMPYADLYEARYDVAGRQANGGIQIDEPVRTARLVAQSYDRALLAARQIMPHVKGALALDLELRDVRMIDASIVVAVEQEP